MFIIPDDAVVSKTSPGVGRMSTMRAEVKSRIAIYKVLERCRTEPLLMQEGLAMKLSEQLGVEQMDKEERAVLYRWVHWIMIQSHISREKIFTAASTILTEAGCGLSMNSKYNLDLQATENDGEGNFVIEDRFPGLTELLELVRETLSSIGVEADEVRLMLLKSAVLPLHSQSDLYKRCAPGITMLLMECTRGNDAALAHAWTHSQTPLAFRRLCKGVCDAGRVYRFA